MAAPTTTQTATTETRRRVTLVVAAVAGIGLAWNQFASGTLIGDLPGPSRQPILPRGPLPNGRVLIVPVDKGRGSWGIYLQPGMRPPRSLLKRGIVVVVRGGSMDLGLGSMFEPVN